MLKDWSIHETHSNISYTQYLSTIILPPSRCFCKRRWSIARPYDFVGITCFGYVILIRHNCLVSMLVVLLFLCQYETFILNHTESEHSCHNKKNYIEIMPSSIPHQKFCFYHIPTRGRAGIKLWDAWYVSNVSIIFYCSMLYYILFWMFNGLYYTLLYYFWD